MKRGRRPTQPIPEDLRGEFYVSAWELAWAGICYRRRPAGAGEPLFASFGDRQPAARRHGLVILWCTAAALRFSELANLRLDAVDAVASTVTVRHAKGGRAAVVPVVPELIAATRAYLRRCPSNSPLLLPSRAGTPLDNDAFNRDCCKPLGELFGIRLSSHCFRDTAADLGMGVAAAKGLDVRAVQRLMGHAAAGTTEVYLRKSAPEPIQVPLFEGGGDGR